MDKTEQGKLQAICKRTYNLVSKDWNSAERQYCAPTIADEIPPTDPLWQTEMFLPIVTLAAVDSLDEAMRYANDVDYGLTAGFYSSDPGEIEWFLNNIEASSTYIVTAQV
ncbi:MAG: aldehyde dehydrogenase family protein [Chloroflexi bacterium]|nr:aldehyde dehydrogenase family protein [Chloroflexota bacterium]